MIVEAPNYIVNGDMSLAVIEGAAITVCAKGHLRAEISWANTGNPIGTLTLEYLALDASWKVVPDVTFAAHPNSDAKSYTAHWYNLHVYGQLRIKYTRSSGGTANTSLVVRVAAA